MQVRLMRVVGRDTKLHYGHLVGTEGHLHLRQVRPIYIPHKRTSEWVRIPKRDVFVKGDTVVITIRSSQTITFRVITGWGSRTKKR